MALRQTHNSEQRDSEINHKLQLHENRLNDSLKNLILNGQSKDPIDPKLGNSVMWLSDGIESGNAGDLMVKVNVAGVVTTVTLITAYSIFTEGSIPFADSTGKLIENNSNFYWDPIGLMLGIRNSNPTEALEVGGNVRLFKPGISPYLSLLNSGGSSTIRFDTEGNSYINRFTGNLGIRTSIPDAILTVEGTQRVSAGKIENNQTGLSYTAVLGDAGKRMTSNNSGLAVHDLPPNSSIVYEVGAILEWENLGSNTFELKDEAGVSIVTLAAISGIITEKVILINKGPDQWTATKF